MVQTSGNDGIICDCCKDTYVLKFVYYSYDFKHVLIFDGRKPSMDAIIRSDTIKSLDLCQQCHLHVARKIVENYKNNRNNSIICELSGQKIQDEFYYCVISKADVNLNSGTDIQVDQRHLEISVCSGIYETFVNNNGNLKELL